MRENFSPAGEVEYAAFAANPPPFISTSHKPIFTKTQKDGLRYEARAQGYVEKLCGKFDNLRSICNPWVLFHSLSDGPTRIQFCQPDCLVVDSVNKKLTIIECKLSHTPDSWKQIRQLYEPVLKCIPEFRGYSFAAIEMCKWFDPHKGFPETYYYAENVLEAIENRFGIHIYKPRGRG
jgi:hypothetical protein